MLARVHSLFITANYIEAALWGTIGIGFLLHALLRRGGASSFVASVAFLLFGLSDVIETRTGAWWRPWWLLVLKGMCLAVFLVLLARYALAKRTRPTPDTAHPRTSTPASP
ncbi:MAG TPA: hypothetical protein VGR35_18765 [Tepidisphaeraceae bacterium]|nr:hypothetical protein [Tepidisphaeraceae bacterium]